MLQEDQRSGVLQLRLGAVKRFLKKLQWEIVNTYKRSENIETLSKEIESPHK